MRLVDRIISVSTWDVCVGGGERLMSEVNHLDYDNKGQKLYFDRVYYRRGSGNNTDVNEVGVDAVDEYDCCVRCQEAVCLLPIPSPFSKL